MRQSTAPRNTASASTELHSRIGWLAVALLLLLRIPYSIILTYATSDNTGWAPAFFQLATYLLTLFLIWWERDDLRGMHIDAPALLLVVLFKPAQTLILRHWGIETPITFPHPAALLIWAASLTLLIAFWRSGFKAAKTDPIGWAWLGGGLMAGLLLSAIPNLDAFLGHATQPVGLLRPLAASTGLAFSYQLGFAAASEEPLFRAFLWGYLRRLGWREPVIWLVQAALFMLAHLYFINALGFQFWVVVPVAGLTFGLFAWRSRSIAPGMLAHAAYNAGAYVLALSLFMRLR